MKKLGLLGGMGPESTVVYYRDLNKIIYEKTKGKCFPEFAIDSIDLCTALNYCKEADYEKLTSYLLKSINNLAKAGADFAALSANTMHIVFKSLEEQSPIPLVSIIDTVCEEAKRRGLKRIGLLGTIFTMKEDFFKQPFIEQGIEIITPSDEIMDLVNNIIANELELGIIKKESTKQLINVIKNMKENDNIEAVILGCTELPLALSDENSPVPCLDTMNLHINKLANLMLK